MYLVNLKTLLTEAISKTFDEEYPEANFRGLHASTEFPVERLHFPGIWVDYNPIGSLQVAGVGHIEYADPSAEGNSRRISRWRFQGEASFTVVAMSSLERDRLHDEMIRVMAFGQEQPSTSEFRAYIEDNEFLAVNFDFDEIATRGFAATMGTPWQTDEMIYEAEIAMECFGEFIADDQTGTLVPLSAIEFLALGPTDPDTTETDGQGDWASL